MAHVGFLMAVLLGAVILAALVVVSMVLVVVLSRCKLELGLELG
jgi:hypothetical protein